MSMALSRKKTDSVRFRFRSHAHFSEARHLHRAAQLNGLLSITLSDAFCVTDESIGAAERRNTYAIASPSAPVDETKLVSVGSYIFAAHSRRRQIRLG